MKPMAFPTFDAELHGELVSTEDYTRRAFIGLAIERLRREDVPGAFAEAGVYRGGTSKVIHRLAPERVLYLMDTFEGFPRGEVEDGTNRGGYEPIPVSDIREKVGDSPNVRILKGRVQDRFLDIEEEAFAFVLLDLDTYKPTLASLHFFWPRLAVGGYIYVHDYNNPESNHGCRRAVDEFFAGTTVPVVDIPDQWGSVVLRRVM